MREKIMRTYLPQGRSRLHPVAQSIPAFPSPPRPRPQPPSYSATSLQNESPRLRKVRAGPVDDRVEPERVVDADDCGRSALQRNETRDLGTCRCDEWNAFTK